MMNIFGSIDGHGKLIPRPEKQMPESATSLAQSRRNHIRRHWQGERSKVWGQALFCWSESLAANPGHQRAKSSRKRPSSTLVRT